MTTIVLNTIQVVVGKLHIQMQRTSTSVQRITESPESSCRADVGGLIGEMSSLVSAMADNDISFDPPLWLVCPAWLWSHLALVSLV